MRIRTILALTKDTTYDITGGMKEGKVSDKDGGPATRTSPYISSPKITLEHDTYISSSQIAMLR
jgi:hypothetical protein